MAYRNSRPYNHRGSPHGRHYDPRNIDIGHGFFSNNYSRNHRGYSSTRDNRRDVAYSNDRNSNNIDEILKYVDKKFEMLNKDLKKQRGPESNRYSILPNVVDLSSNSSAKNVNKNNKKKPAVPNKPVNPPSKNPQQKLKPKEVVPKKSYKDNFFTTVVGKVQNTPEPRPKNDQPKLGKPENQRMNVQKLSSTDFNKFKTLRRQFMDVLYLCSQVNNFVRKGLSIRFPKFDKDGVIPGVQKIMNMLATRIYNEIVEERDYRFTIFVTDLRKSELPPEYMKLVMIMAIKFYRSRHGHAVRPWKTCKVVDEFLRTFLKWNNSSVGVYLTYVDAYYIKDVVPKEDALSCSSVDSDNLIPLNPEADESSTRIFLVKDPLPEKIPKMCGPGSKKI